MTSIWIKCARWIEFVGSAKASSIRPGPEIQSWRGRGLMPALLSLASIATATPIYAQSTPYDPYATPALQSNGSGPNANGFGAGAAGSSQYQPGNGSGASAGQMSSTVDVFGPVVIPNSTSSGVDDQNDRSTSLVRTTHPDDGPSHGPVYVRPGSSPGQFELFQRPPPDLGEFEKFVKESVGRPLPRFGSALILTRARGFAVAPTTTVPPDYMLNPGDELLIGVTGSVEANLHLVIDAEGRIFIPRIGAVTVAGLRYGDLARAITDRFNEQFKKAKVSVVIGRLHGLNVYVTGYAVTPGAYTVSSLSTMVDAVLAAGGPAAGGSFRTVQLRRNGQLVTTLDLYDLLLNGDKSHDAILQNEDVITIAPVGPEVAVTGSVNAEAIYEAKPGETLGALIGYAGGPDSLADTSRVVVTRLGDLDAGGSRQLDFASAKASLAERGDIVRILSLAHVARPLERQAILATIEGEVDHPGRYYLRPGSTMADLLAQAGGLTRGAFVYGAKVERESVKLQQQASYNSAIDNLQLAAAALPLSASALNGQATVAATRSQGVLAIIERLKQQKPDGRVILALGPTDTALPGNITLENNDRVFIPPEPRTVGVFGAVYQTGSFLYSPGHRVGDYLKLSGGPQRFADRGDIFVVRANGSVLSNHETHNLASRPALPGDVIFVPVRASGGIWDKIVNLAAVVSQFAVGALTFKALGV